MAATKTLEGLIERQPAFAEAYVMLGAIYQKQGKQREAEKIYNKALETEGIPSSYKARIAVQLNALKQ
jgi:Tfp pilus assembly protein PilF